MTKKNEKILLVALVLFVLGVIIFNYLSRKEIIEDYEVTGGKIVAYSMSGDFNDQILTYEYFVEGNRFSRKFTTLNQIIDSCYYNLENCEYKLTVIYSKKDNCKSLINLERLYVDGEKIDKEDLNLNHYK